MCVAKLQHHRWLILRSTDLSIWDYIIIRSQLVTLLFTYPFVYVFGFAEIYDAIRIFHNTVGHKITMGGIKAKRSSIKTKCNDFHWAPNFGVRNHVIIFALLHLYHFIKRFGTFGGRDTTPSIAINSIIWHHTDTIRHANRQNSFQNL